MERKKAKKSGRVGALEGLGGEIKKSARAYLFPMTISTAVFAVVFAITLIITKIMGSTPVFAYALLYISIISLFVISAATPVYSLWRALTKGERYDIDERKKMRRVSPASVTLGKFIPTAAMLLFASILRTASDYALTVLGGLSYDGYIRTLIGISIALFGASLYVAALITASILKYPKNTGRASRKVISDIVMLYTVGLFILALILLIFSGLPMGSDALEDLTESGINTEAAPLLGCVYLLACTVRTVWLFFVAKRRIYRVFFVKNNTQI
ncbi:MAG: hypothetical protein LUH54_05760 [Firmicutes bacterium]|nr:hypothetical protein [Bacillota bacterium]